MTTKVYNTAEEAAAAVAPGTKSKTYRCALGDKVVHVNSTNAVKAGNAAFLAAGGTVTHTKAAPLATPEDILAAIAALPEATRAALAPQLKKVK